MSIKDTGTTETIETTINNLLTNISRETIKTELPANKRFWNTGRPCGHLAGHRSVKTTGTKPTKETIRTIKTFSQQIFRKKGRKPVPFAGNAPCPGSYFKQERRQRQR